MQCGVYWIYHFPSGKSYVGESGQPRIRWAQHRRLLRRGEHTYLEMQAAWDADGEKAFDFRVVVPMPASSTTAERRIVEDAVRDLLWGSLFDEWRLKRCPKRSRPRMPVERPEWPFPTPTIKRRTHHLGPPPGMPERRVVMYPGRRDHIRLAALRAEQQAERTYGVLPAPAAHSNERVAPAPWRFPPMSAPSPQRAAESTGAVMDRSGSPDQPGAAQTARPTRPPFRFPPMSAPVARKK